MNEPLKSVRKCAMKDGEVGMNKLDINSFAIGVIAGGLWVMFLVILFGF